MKVDELTLVEWQGIIDTCGLPSTPARAMRCENTQLTIARFYGGITFNGHTYRYFEPWHQVERAMLLVRDDVVKHAAKLKPAPKVRAPEAVQGELGL